VGRRRLNVGIVGCGAIGRKRAQHLAGARLVHCVDTDAARADQAASFGNACTAGTDWRALLDRGDVQAIIIATPPGAQAEIARAAILAGIHVLVEKPAARHVGELLGLPQLAAERGVRVRVGFNHRYHRAFQEARRLVDSGMLGPLMFLRARYGHGGRPGYAREWRAQPAQSGGGELIDQGVHLIDLARWELYGRDGKLQVDGLGGSYGVEKLSWYKNLPGMGPPQTTIWEYPMADNSWEIEMAEFIEDVGTGRDPSSGLQDAIAALAVVAEIYSGSGYDHRP
jgi:predicted dehydrogenase